MNQAGCSALPAFISLSALRGRSSLASYLANGSRFHIAKAAVPGKTTAIPGQDPPRAKAALPRTGSLSLTRCRFVAIYLERDMCIHWPGVGDVRATAGHARGKGGKQA